MQYLPVLLRLRPDKKQQRRLCKTIGTCRDTYNRLMDEAVGTYLEEGRAMPVYEPNALLPPMKEEHPEMREVHSLALQNISRRVSTALSQAIGAKRKDGKTVLPKKRGPDRYRSFELPSPMCFSLKDGKLFPGKMMKDAGGIRHRCNQKIRGDIKTCAVFRRKNHRYARIVCAVEDRGTVWFGRDRPEVGLDLGLINRIALSDGTVYEHERYKGIWEEIGKIQQKMSELEPGTARCEKLARRAANRYRRMANLRRNEPRHAAKEIAEGHEMVAMEDIDIKKLVQRSGKEGSAALNTLRRGGTSAGSWTLLRKQRAQRSSEWTPAAHRRNAPGAGSSSKRTSLSGCTSARSARSRWTGMSTLHSTSWPRGARP